MYLHFEFLKRVVIIVLEVLYSIIRTCCYNLNHNRSFKFDNALFNNNKKKTF